MWTFQVTHARTGWRGGWWLVGCARILREVAPDGAEALVAVAEAAERAWDRAPELDVDAILAKAKADAEAAANGAAH